MTEYHISIIDEKGMAAGCAPVKRRIDAARDAAWHLAYSRLEGHALLDRPVAWNVLRAVNAYTGGSVKIDMGYVGTLLIERLP